MLDDAAKEQFRSMMWAAADFCGVQLLTYAILSNHFHLLLRIPVSPELTDQELYERVRRYFGAENRYTRSIEADLAANGKISSQLRNRLIRRMADLSLYLKELKQRFTRWFNQVHDRYGTLWAERFKSTLVEDEPEALRFVAAYIDLNCVRAGLVDDPKDYRFCGYAEAIAQGGQARQGLAAFLAGADWSSQSQEYRKYLFCRSGVPGSSSKHALDRQTILAKMRDGAQIDPAQLLRLKVRYFTDGAVLGSRVFVNEVFLKFRQHFGSKRATGARTMAGGPWGSLMVLRKLRLNVFG